MFLEDTIVAVSSPPGAALRGIVRLSGPDAFRLAAGLFTSDEPPALPDVSDNRCIDGRIRVGPAVLPATCWCFRGPRSYTRQDIVELHLLGAPAVLAILVESLLAAGARRAEPGEFTARAFLAGAMDIAQVHGVAAMIAARSDDQLRAAERLLHGALSRTAHDAREELADLLSLVEGALDFADEPIEFIAPDELRRRLSAVRETLQRVVDAGLRTERWGRLPRVVLVGPPNAGKSTLMNRLTGMDRSICAAVAGTTRDVLSAPLQLPDGECLLFDVAGWDAPRNEIDARARHAAQRAMDDADLLLLVQDCEALSPPAAAAVVAPVIGAAVLAPANSAALVPPANSRCAARRDPWTDGRLAASDTPVILVLNKRDRLSPAERDRLLARCRNSTAKPVCCASALDGGGCRELLDLIASCLQGRTRDADDAALALMAEHREALLHAVETVAEAERLASAGLDQADLVAVELHDAADRLAALVGRELPDETLGRIFARFCVGK